MDDILMIASVAVTLFGVFMLRYKRFRRLRHYIGWYFLIVGCVMLLRITLFPQAPLAFGRLSYNILVIGSVIAFLFLLFPIAVLDPKALTPRYILTVAAPAGGVLFCLALSGSTPELDLESLRELPRLWTQGNRSVHIESLMRLLAFVLVQFYTYWLCVVPIRLARKHPGHKRWLYGYLAATETTMLFYNLWLIKGGAEVIALNRIAFTAVCFFWTRYSTFPSESNDPDHKEPPPMLRELSGVEAPSEIKTISCTEEKLSPSHEAFRQRIEKLKPWLDSELTLPALAHRLGTIRTTLSSLIRNMGYANFNAFLNMHRTETFKQKLCERLTTILREEEKVSAVQQRVRKIDLLALGYESGFKSPSTFYRSVNQYEKLTPNDYLQKTLQDMEHQAIERRTGRN